jgi:hypothetical protein
MAITFQGTVSSFPILGNDQLLQNLFIFENGAASRVNVNIRRLVLQNDSVAALTSVMPLIKTSRLTADPSGGIFLSKCPFDTNQTSDPAVRAWASIAFGTPITATEGQPVWGKFSIRLHTGYGKVISPDASMLSQLVEDAGKEYKLRPGESVLVQVRGATIASNPSLGNNWWVQAMWEEDSLPVFNISGIVTLASAPVSGANVMIMQADDEYMTNAILWDVQTTDVNGQWASTILSGKVGAAFVQYTNGGVYYTAPGSPFLES